MKDIRVYNVYDTSYLMKSGRTNPIFYDHTSIYDLPIFSPIFVYTKSGKKLNDRSISYDHILPDVVMDELDKFKKTASKLDKGGDTYKNTVDALNFVSKLMIVRPYHGTFKGVYNTKEIKPYNELDSLGADSRTDKIIIALCLKILEDDKEGIVVISTRDAGMRYSVNKLLSDGYKIFDWSSAYNVLLNHIKQKCINNPKFYYYNGKIVKR